MNPLNLVAPIAILLSLCLPQSYCAAQEKSKKQTATPAPADFEVPASSIIDSNTSAIILSDIGSIHFIGNDKNGLSHVFKRHTRIKILNKKAFDLATVKIPINTQDFVAEKLDNLSASTYNLENGKVVETRLDKKEIFQEREDKNHIEAKFTMPAVKEGAIIQYTYTITSDYVFILPVWEFQSMEYPCLWSEYEVTIPQVYFYVTVKQGVHDFTIDKGGERHESYKMNRKPDGIPLV